MKFIRLTSFAIAGGLLFTPTYSAAQNEEVEQGLGKFLKSVSCKFLPEIVGAIPGIGSVAKAGSEILCGKQEGSSSSNGGDAPVSEQLPAMQAQLFKIVPNNGNAEPDVSPATPDTRYAKGEGFAVILSHNSSGYLEVWSVDATSSTMIEAMVLPNKAGIVILPKKEVGYYEMTTTGGTDKIRIRFLPCAPSQQHAFAIAPNARVGELVGNEAKAVDALAAKLPPCPFDGDVNTSVANDDFFDGFSGVKPNFSAELGAYTAISTNKGPIQFDITLKRN